MNISLPLLIVISVSFLFLLLIVFFLFSRKSRENQQALECLLIKELKENQLQMTEKLYQGQMDITQRVNQQLNEGLEKSTATFTNVVERLTIIDEAQKKMSELSSNVISLQNILSNKSARGALGEVQLSNLIQNMIPSSHYALQYPLSNGKRADCVLFLPEPTGHIVIDAKFPLENYQRIVSCSQELEKIKLMQQFKQDIKKHIKDIMEKYIIPNETANGAVMFIPAESVFAEIHANYPELVQYSHDCNVWLVSPTTLMAVLTTARAVLKDDATKKQVHVIQKHLKDLAEDFKRFDKRMQNLTRYIQQANDEAGNVHISSKKITRRFDQIEQVDLQPTASSDISIGIKSTVDKTSLIKESF
jgi:DNA recombination protein RmuC